MKQTLLLAFISIAVCFWFFAVANNEIAAQEQLAQTIAAKVTTLIEAKWYETQTVVTLLRRVATTKYAQKPERKQLLLRIATIVAWEKDTDATLQEFSISDTKYKIVSKWQQSVFEFLQENSVTANPQYDKLIFYSDPTCAIQPNTKAYETRLSYYRDLLQEYSADDMVTIYVIQDTTSLAKNTANGWTSEWMTVFVMDNKMWYTTLEEFKKDFTENCEIQTRIPALVSKKHVIFFDGCYCGAWCSEDCEKIRTDMGKKLQLE